VSGRADSDRVSKSLNGCGISWGALGMGWDRGSLVVVAAALARRDGDRAGSECCYNLSAVGLCNRADSSGRIGCKLLGAGRNDRR
jgi:hypothetical protein